MPLSADASRFDFIKLVSANSIVHDDIDLDYLDIDDHRAAQRHQRRIMFAGGLFRPIYPEARRQWEERRQRDLEIAEAKAPVPNLRSCSVSLKWCVKYNPQIPQITICIS